MKPVYISDKFQVAEIIENVLDDFKNCSQIYVRQATFSISEEFIRRIYRLKLKSNARFSLIIDRKALQKTKLLWNFLINVYDEIYLADNHAKVILVCAENPQANPPVAVLTSQNLTRGNRHESTVISKDPKVFQNLSDDFDFIVRYKSMPMHEIMPAQIGQPDPEADSQAEQIEKLAGIFMKISDIAVILEIPVSVLRNRLEDHDDPFFKAYIRGKAKAKAAVRAQEMQLAQLGSPLGVQNVRDNLLDMEEDE